MKTLFFYNNFNLTYNIILVINNTILLINNTNFVNNDIILINYNTNSNSCAQLNYILCDSFIDKC